MQLRKLATSVATALLAGATLAAPAFGQTLEDLPAPFISDSMADFVVVVGADAATADVVGAVDISARFGGETVTTGGGGTTVGTSGGDSWRVQKTGEDLNYDDSFADVDGTIDESDLPVILEDGTLKDNEGNTDNDVSYTQRLKFKDGTATLVYEADGESTRNGETDVLGTYLKLADGTTDWEFEVNFDEAVDFDNTSSTTTKDDFQGVKLKMLGNTYTITDAKQSDGSITKLELLGGAVEANGVDEQTVTVSFDGVDYDVTPSIFSSTEARFTVEWDGNTEQTSALDEGDTRKLGNGVEIGVDDIFYSDKETKTSSVNFRLGARKVTIEDGKRVKVNDNDIRGSSATITANGDSTVTRFNVSFDVEDDAYLAEGEEWAEPVFGAFKYVFSGLEDVETEQVKMSTGTKDGKLTLLNAGGDTLRLDVEEISSDVHWGDDPAGASVNITVDGTETEFAGSTAGNLLWTNGDDCYAANGTTTDAALATACEDILLLVVGSGGEARVLEITDVDTTDTELDLSDKTTGKSFNNKDYTPGSETSIDLGFATIKVTVHDASSTADFDGTGGSEVGIKFGTLNEYSTNTRFTTVNSHEVELFLNQSGTTEVPHIEIRDEDEKDLLFSWNVTRDSDGDVIMDGLVGHSNGAVDFSDSDDDTQGLLDGANNADGGPWGAVLTYDSDDKNSIDVEIPAAMREGIAFVAENTVQTTGTTATGDRSGQVTTSVSKLDTEVRGQEASQPNLVLVGGPCANLLVADLADTGDYPWTCDEAVALGNSGYSIDVINDAFADGQVALVVAGLHADDTREAAGVVQNFDTEGLTGTSHRTGAFAGA